MHVLLAFVFYAYLFSGIVVNGAKKVWVHGSWYDCVGLIAILAALCLNDRGNEASEHAQDIHGYQCVDDFDE
jgi:uncharacterized membrane protein